MKFTSVVVTALALAVPTFAQSGLSGLPSCAQAPLVQGISSSGCQLTDVACICKNTAFLRAIGSEITKACSPADVAKTEQIAAQLCAEAGVPISIPSGPTAPAGTAPPGVVTTPASNATVTVPSPTTSTSSQFSGAATKVEFGKGAVALVAMGVAAVL